MNTFKTTLQDCQTLMEVKPDGIPGPITNAAWKSLCAGAVSTPDAPFPAPVGSTPAPAGGPSFVLATIEGHDIDFDGSMVSYTAKAAIDDDGSGPSLGDPDYQNATSLKVNGVSLDATKEAYIVVPPAILETVSGIVLGCQAEVAYGTKSVRSVVADIGPSAKLGEISIACAEALGIPSSPTSGGVSSGVSYKLWPGVPAQANGKTYPLQKA